MFKYSVTLKPGDRLKKHRFIEPKTGCWIWTGSLTDRGYGKIKINGKTIAVHRLSLSIWGSFNLESESQVNHSCDNRACFNPEHLKEGTQKDNVRDCIERGRRAIPKSRRCPSCGKAWDLIVCNNCGHTTK